VSAQPTRNVCPLEVRALLAGRWVPVRGTRSPGRAQEIADSQPGPAVVVDLDADGKVMYQNKVAETWGEQNAE